MSEGTTPPPEERPGGEPGYGQGWGTSPPPQGGGSSGGYGGGYGGPPPGQGGGYGGPPPGQQGGPGWGGQQGGPGGGWQPGGGTGGMSESTASGLSYVLTFLTGAIFLILDRRPEVRFHAMQSILFGVAWLVVAILRAALHFFPFNLVLWLAWLGGLVLWIMLMIQAFQGRHYKLPWIGDIAEQQATRT
jgi:uncharacterized membrane protein